MCFSGSNIAKIGVSKNRRFNSLNAVFSFLVQANVLFFLVRSVSDINTPEYPRINLR